MDELSLPFFVCNNVWQNIQKRVGAFEKGYRQNIALLGGEGIGKTSLMTSLYSSLSHEPDFIPVYIHAEHLDYQNMVERWIGAVLTGFFSGQMVKPPAKLESLLQSAEPIIPKTVQAMKSLRKNTRKDKKSTSVKELFGLTGILTAETSKKVVLMIDEFQELDHLPSSDPFALFGREIMVQTETFYLISSSATHRSKEIMHDKLSLLFGNFETMALKPLRFEEVTHFLKWLLPDFQFTEEQHYYIIRMTDGYPLYLKLFAEKIKNLVGTRLSLQSTMGYESGIPVSDLHVIKALHDELGSSQGAMYQIFQRRVQYCKSLFKNNAGHVKALLAISQGRKKLISISSYIEKRTTETKAIMQRLIREEIVAKKGSFYVIEDSLFQFWLAEVYERDQHLYGPDRESLQSEFQEVLKREFDACKALIKMDVIQRVSALLEEFRNDVIEIDGVRIKCPQFTEIQYRPTQAKTFPILAKNQKLRWLCQVFESSIVEEDILQFVEEAKRYRRNRPSRMMIALNGIDQNAKLMAKEAKIQLWDLKLLNVLLDLYGLPKMILMRSTPPPAFKMDAPEGAHTA